MTVSKQSRRIYNLVLAADNSISGDKLPESKMVKVRLEDDLAPGSQGIFLCMRIGDKMNWWVRGPYRRLIRVSDDKLSTLTGRDFVKQLDPRAQKTFEEATEEFLKSKCPDFRDLVAFIDRDFGMSMTPVRTTRYVGKKGKGGKGGRKIEVDAQVEMWNPILEDADRYKILKGDMQSRKSWAFITAAMYLLLRYRMSTFIVVQNSLDASEQLVNRIRDVFAEYANYMEDEQLKEKYEELFGVLDCVRGKTETVKNLEKAMNGKKPKIYVVLRNSTDINPVNQLVEEMKTRRFVVVIDESDFNDSGTKATVQTALGAFKKHAGIVYDVTATPMTSLCKEDIDTGNVFCIQKPPGYKGVLHIDCVDLKHKASYCTGTDDNPFQKDPNLKKYIKDFVKTKPHHCKSQWGKQWHPRYALVRFGTTIKPQLKVAAWVHKKYPSKVVAITYNGSGHGVTLRGDALPDEPIILDDGTESKVEEGVHTFGGGIHIGKIIAHLQENGGVRRYPRIMVFAGKMADRGITFGTANYGKCVQERCYPWHLTEMYFIAAKTMTQSNLLQAAGRLCGCYPDNVPLTLYTNAGNDVYKSYGVQEELIQRAMKGRVKAAFRKLRKTMDEEKKIEEETERVFVKDLLPELPISRDKCAKRRITAPRVRCPLRKVENDFVYGGLDWDAEGYTYTATEADFGTGHRNKKAKVIMTEEERDEMREDAEVRRVVVIEERKKMALDEKEFARLVKMFPRWSKGNTKVANFMHNLDPRKEYTRAEIVEEASNVGIRITDCHLSAGQKRVKYGNIIQHTGDTYRLYPCLVEAFEKNFNA